MLMSLLRNSVRSMCDVTGFGGDVGWVVGWRLGESVRGGIYQFVLMSDERSNTVG